MGILSFFKKAPKNQKAQHSDSPKKSKSFEEIEEEIYFEDHYMDKAESLSDQYDEICFNLECDFGEIFDLNKRIKMIEKAINKFNEWKDFCYSKGNAGRTYFDENYSPHSKNIFVPTERDFNGDYVSEFETADFHNIDFLQDLLNEYITEPEKSKEHLKNEHIFYCGGLEEYEFMLKKQSLSKDVLKVIKKNEGILQKDLYSLFDKRLKSHIPKAVKELSASGKIIAEKSGNSYSLKTK